MARKTVRNLRDKLAKVGTTYRVHLFAIVWIAAVGAAAYGLSTLAPEGEAAGGVYLAAIALGGYRLTGWALDVLAPILIERVVWPILGDKRKAGGVATEAFSSSVRMLSYAGRTIHLGKRPELKEEFASMAEQLEKIRRELVWPGMKPSRPDTEYASLSPRHHIKVARWMDLSDTTPSLLDQVEEESLKSAVFEMPDGSFWRASSNVEGGLSRVRGMYGDEANEYIELVRISK